MKSKSWADKSVKYDLSIIIGRFQPLHNGHLELIKKAFEVSNKVLILIGSSYLPRTIKNPFTGGERMEMIKITINRLVRSGDLDGNVDFRIEMLSDHQYSDTEWLEEVQTFINSHNDIYQGTVCLVGHKKDHTSYYLDMFPKYDLVEVPNVAVLNSTTIRDIYFGNGMIPKDVMPDFVVQYLDYFKDKKEYNALTEEYQYIAKYKLQFVNAPFPPTFVTVDAVVINSGHVLMVRRRIPPGKGLLALPGGFLNQHETIRDGMLRELEEETRIKIPKEKLIASIRTSHVFDAPNRSLRGRTITHAFLIQLFEKNNPKVRGSDDAERAVWIPISDFRKMQEQCFEDHFPIATSFINRAA